MTSESTGRRIGRHLGVERPRATFLVHARDRPREQLGSLLSRDRGPSAPFTRRVTGALNARGLTHDP